MLPVTEGEKIKDEVSETIENFLLASLKVWQQIPEGNRTDSERVWGASLKTLSGQRLAQQNPSGRTEPRDVGRSDLRG